MTHYDKTELLLDDGGKSAVIRVEALELLARDIAEHKTGPKLVDLLQRCGVPTEMIIYPNTKWKTLLDAFLALSTSPNYKENKILYKVIEAVVHPLFFGGDKNKATETEKKYNEWLKYDHIAIEYGKLYIGPTEEEHDLGITEWRDTDGNEIEPEVHFWYPDHLAQLWVLWSQLIVLVSAYENNEALGHKELEKLYLEVIGKVEELLRVGDLGPLKKTYKRPFTSLATAHIEAKAKKAGSPSDLINSFLLEIATLKPHTTEVSKAMEENSELIERIAKATRAISGEEIKLSELSYEPPQKEEKKETGNEKVLTAIEDAIVKGFKNLSFGSQDQQTPQKIEITNKELVVRNAEENREKNYVGKKKTFLKDKVIEFDESQPAISIDGKICALPPAKNEEYLAKVMFRRKAGEFVDWSIIYKEMTGTGEVIGDENDKKSVRDTMNRLNKRVQEIMWTDDKLLSLENKSIKRNY